MRQKIVKKGTWFSKHGRRFMRGICSMKNREAAKVNKHNTLMYNTVEELMAASRKK